MEQLKIDYIPIADIKPYKRNAKQHPEEQIQQIANSIREFGFNDPIAIDENNVIIEGHGRMLALQRLIKSGDYTENTIPVIRLLGLTEQQKKAYVLAHNKLTMNTGFDLDLLNKELDSIYEFDMSDFGFTDEESIMMDEQQQDEEASLTLSERFIIPPFTVLNGASGDWQKRKKAWKHIIKDDGSARTGGASLLQSRSKFFLKVNPNTKSATIRNSAMNGASLLDPVLAELMITWFMPRPENGTNVFDCFAGDTVFGYVSAYLNKKFTGIELRKEQADFNQQRLNTDGLDGTYICDDGRNVLKHLGENTQDFFFSCPPYYDMEVYSNDKNDASNQKTYEDFYKILDEAFTAAGKCLKNNRFAVVVASDMRNHKDGGYYNFVGDIKQTFLKNGFLLYDELIFVRPISTSAMFAADSMRTRKVRRIHEDIIIFFKGDKEKIRKEYGTDFSDFLTDRQNEQQHEDILVFYKGDPQAIKADFGEVESDVVFPEDEEINVLNGFLEMEEE